MTGLDTETPPSLSCWLSRVQPHMGFSADIARIFSTTSGGVVMGCDL